MYNNSAHLIPVVASLDGKAENLPQTQCLQDFQKKKIRYAFNVCNTDMQVLSSFKILEYLRSNWNANHGENSITS
ncbi:hypothetical protein T12_6289 [Trichinella patagoniensis]|uniref:Uncharacterized protein n=1 Tax=Trichinella patagoniensis TaxID=990121 RepID=A0A0V0ZBE6_9BILA|nr:hypothetical protein T12_6289 [Trichinella patagoniensis]